MAWGGKHGARDFCVHCGCMKFLAAGLIFVVFAGVSAQDQPDNRVHFACTAITPLKLLKCHTTLGYDNLHVLAEDSRYTSGADFARHARVGDQWWPVGGGTIVVTLAASDIRHDDRIYTLTGQAEIHTTTMDIEADDAVYHADTGAVEARGDMRVKPSAPAQ